MLIRILFLSLVVAQLSGCYAAPRIGDRTVEVEPKNKKQEQLPMFDPEGLCAPSAGGSAMPYNNERQVEIITVSSCVPAVSAAPAAAVKPRPIIRKAKPKCPEVKPVEPKKTC